MTFAVLKVIKIMTPQKYLSIPCLAAIQIYFNVLVTWLTPTQLQQMCQILSQLQRTENKTPESNFSLHQKGSAASETKPDHHTNWRMKKKKKAPTDELQKDKY